MKHLFLILTSLSALSLVSCSAISDTQAYLARTFESSVKIENAYVVSASRIKNKKSNLVVLGDPIKPRRVQYINNMNTDGLYQTLNIRAEDKLYKGNLDYDGERIYSGQRGTLYIGKKTGEFKRFEPTY